MDSIVPPSRSATRSPHLAFFRCLALLVALAPSVLPAQQPAETPAGYQAIEVRSVPAAELAPRLRQLLRESDPTAEVLIDAERQVLLVRGSDAAQRVARELVQTLDRPGMPPRGPVGPQGAAPPAEALPVVRGYAVAPERLGDLVASLRRRFADQQGIRIASDDRTSQLVVVAPAAVQTEVARLLGTGPVETPILAPTARPAEHMAAGPFELKLQHLTPAQLEHHLRSIWTGAVDVSAREGGREVGLRLTNPDGAVTTVRLDRASGQVRVEAPRGLERSWQQLIQSLDAPAAATETRQVFPVRQADPARVRYAVAMLQDAARAAAAAAQQEEEQVEDGQPVDPQEEPQPEVPPGEEPFEEGQPDMPPIIAQPDGDRAGTALEALDEAGLLGDVRIEFIPELGVIVLIGRERDVQRVQRIIADIEEKARTLQPEVQIVPLRYVNSQALAALIVQLYDSVFASRQGPLSITSLDKPNSILLIGRQEAMQPIIELIGRLDQPVAPTTQLKVFPLRYISAVDAERLVRGFFVNQPGGTTAAAAPGAPAAAAGTERPGLGTRVRVLAEYRTNALIVQAAPRDLAELALFIRSIDKEAPLATHEIRIFRLQNTLAQDVAPILQGAITNSPVTTAGQPGAAQAQVQAGQNNQTTLPSTRLTIVGLDSSQHQLIESGVLTDVGVTADPNTNSLVVRGPGHSMELIAELIRQLDQAPDAAAQIKVFEVENGDATSLAAMLQALFGQPVTAGQGQLGQTLRQVFGDLQTVAPGTGTESSLIPLRFAVDVRTNSIIASGTTGDLEVVEILLLRLDESDIETRKMFVYRLKNAPAIDVAASITQFLTSQRQLIQQQLLFNQAVSPFEQIEREVIVVPELVSNSLIVSVTPRYYEQILQIIEDLDFRPPMVMVQVMICEVLLTDDFEFGVELGLQDSLLFDRGIAGTNSIPGFNFNNNGLPTRSDAGRENVAGQSISTFNLGRSSANLGYGGLVLSAASESVSILVRALQDTGRLQILSRPQVMALDNQVAFVQVGARVPRVTGSTINPQGGTQTQTADVDVGLLLRIQPRINQDGLVVMNIDAENSEVGDIAEGIPVAITDTGQVINSPQINTTTAQTTISAHSGQTVVFAGLITKNRAVRSRRVPYLSDIPVLGRLFRFDAESEERRELLIFMTPYIVNEEEDYDWLKYVESQRMSWCLADVVEMHGDVGLSGGHGLWGPPIAPMIYPDLDPTGTETVLPDGTVVEPVPLGPQPPPLPGEPLLQQQRELPWRAWVGPPAEPVRRQIPRPNADPALQPLPNQPQPAVMTMPYMGDYPLPDTATAGPGGTPPGIPSEYTPTATLPPGPGLPRGR